MDISPTLHRAGVKFYRLAFSLITFETCWPHCYCSLQSSGKACPGLELDSASCRADTRPHDGYTLLRVREGGERGGAINVPNFRCFPSQSCRGQTFARRLRFGARLCVRIFVTCEAIKRLHITRLYLRKWEKIKFNIIDFDVLFISL